MLSIVVSVLALFAPEAPSVEIGPAPAPAPASAAADAKPDERGLAPGQRRIKVICKDHVRAGTRLAKTRCVELSAYQRQQEIDRRAFEEVQNRPIFFLGN